jgi:Flp pilus assembly protein TadD
MGPQEKLVVKYSTSSKALPPQRIRMEIPGWGGSPEKMEDGNLAQPWHCLPFVEASTYGLELIYQYETECQIVNDNGLVRIEWDYAKEPGGELTGGEFVTFFPKEASKRYLFNTRLDVQAPPGYVIRTETHPRFYVDDTGTVPPVIAAHVQSEWWPRKLFVVFKSPPPGQRHIFRKGEPYAQILFVPQKVSYEPVRMTEEEDQRRREQERLVDVAKTQIATNVWHNSSGHQLSNHYKMLASAFTRDGAAGVEQTIKTAAERHEQSLPKEKSIPEALALGAQRIREHKYEEARDIYAHVLGRDPNNAEAMSNLGICVACKGSPMAGLKLMSQAVSLQPRSSVYHGNMGELLRLMGRLADAEKCFRASLQCDPNDVGIMSMLGLIAAQQGRAAEGLEACRRAIQINAKVPVVHFRMGMIQAQQRQFGEARRCYEAALAVDPNFAEARAAVAKLPPG